jgi:chromosome segregation ATPase
MMPLMTVDIAPTDGSVRHCGYVHCTRELPYEGRGRPLEYCQDRRWPGDRTCRQMAAAERMAERAAGLDAPLDAFRAASDRLAMVASPLARQLAELVDAVKGVQDGALTRMRDSEQSSQLAAAQARAAQDATGQARRAQQAAEADRDRARAAAAEADQRAVAARTEADEQIRRAWRRVADADHARGQAETAAAAASQAQAEETARREAAEQRATLTEAELRTLRALLDTERATTAQLRDQLADTTRRAGAAEAATTGLRTELAQVRGERDAAGDRIAALKAELRAAAADRDVSRTAAAQLTGERDQLRHALDGARDTTIAAQRRAERAEARLDQLIASLPAATSHGQP